MENEMVFKMSKALRLERRIAGLRFLAYKTEYEKSLFAPVAHKYTFCGMVNLANQGKGVKARGSDFACDSGARALGVLEVPEITESGRVYRECGLYGSFAVARNVIAGMQYIKHKMYGVEIAPLETMDAADIVIILGNARQMMRVMQGYAYSYGTPKNLCTVGNQAMCSDLIAKPFNNNDINLTLMCKGAREFTKCSDGEMGAGMPVHIFCSLAEGVLATMNLVETNDEKQRILDGLNDPMALGIPVEMNQSYAANADRYIKYCAEQEK